MSQKIDLNSDFNVSKLIIDGDLSRLSADQKSQYYLLRCQEHGLNPSSQPFNYLKLNNKEVLYANKGCAEQLRSINRVSIKITSANIIGDLFVVISDAKDGHGREDSATGAVSIVGLKGEALANAMMKAETKSKRRVTLSICGMNMLDETEVETIKGVPPLMDIIPPAGRAPSVELPKTVIKTRGSLGVKILEAGVKLGLDKAGVESWAREFSNKAATDMSLQEMEAFLEQLEMEIGRMGEIS